MKRRELPASTDASHSYSGGASGFSPSLWNPWSLWAVVLHVWLRNALLVWQIFIYLLVFKWEGYDWLWRASGTRVEGITRTERACGLKILPRVSFLFFFFGLPLFLCCCVVVCQIYYLYSEFVAHAPLSRSNFKTLLFHIRETGWESEFH